MPRAFKGLSPIVEDEAQSENTHLIRKSESREHMEDYLHYDRHTLAAKVHHHGRIVKIILSCVLLICLIELAFIIISWENPNDGDLSFRILPVDPYTGYPQLPLLGRSKKWKCHRAQTIADDYRDSYLRAIESDVLVPLEVHHGHGKNHAMDGCEGTVVIVRHCEKSNIREHCSYMGYERSVFLATLFGDKEERWPKPSYIYAERPGGRSNPDKHNYREIETLLPLADKVKLTIDASYSTESTSDLAKVILGKLASGEMCGKVAVVAWKHTTIATLANKLGCGPNQGCPFDYPGQSFDEAWTIKFVYEKLWHSEHKSGKIPKYARWQVFGSVQAENFDPLRFSKEFGDYPIGGTDHGGRWRGQWADIRDSEDIDEEVGDAVVALGPPVTR